MAIPDYQAAVNDVFSHGDYDLSTKEGCGKFTEAVVAYISAFDSRIGHIKKTPPQNMYNGHAVDACMFKGEKNVVDLVFDSESERAKPQWMEKEDKLVDSQWLDPKDVKPVDEDKPSEPNKPSEPQVPQKPRDPVVTYHKFVTVESFRLAEAYKNKHNHEAAPSDYFHWAWRRLIEGWTIEAMLNDL